MEDVHLDVDRARARRDRGFPRRIVFRGVAQHADRVARDEGRPRRPAERLVGKRAQGGQVGGQCIRTRRDSHGHPAIITVRRTTGFQKAVPLAVTDRTSVGTCPTSSLFADTCASGALASVGVPRRPGLLK